MSVALLLLALAAPDAGWVVDHPRPGVMVLRNEDGIWGGLSLGVAHQNTPAYRIRKTFDLSALPAGALAGAKSARLRLWMCLQDYSFNLGDRRPDGLDERFELLLNGHQHTFATADPRLPGRSDPQQTLAPAWVDFDVPVTELRLGENVVELAKLPDGGTDDYVYPGIDNSRSHGTSATSQDGGQTWSTTRLNAIDASGEFMIRLVLADRDLSGTAVWRPDQVSDPDGVLAFVESPAGGLWLEPRRDVLAPSTALTVSIAYTGTAPAAEWIDPAGRPLTSETVTAPGKLVCTLPAGRHDLGALRVAAPAGGELTAATLTYELSTLEPEPVVDLNPRVAAPWHVRPAGRGWSAGRRRRTAAPLRTHQRVGRAARFPRLVPQPRRPAALRLARGRQLPVPLCRRSDRQRGDRIAERLRGEHLLVADARPVQPVRWRRRLPAGG